MNKTSYKSFAIFALVLLLLFAIIFPQVNSKTYAEENGLNYVTIYSGSDENGQTFYGLQFGVDFKSIAAEDSEKLTFKDNLVNLAKSFCEGEKAKLLNKSQELSGEKFSFDKIIFDDNSDKEKGYFGYEIIFPSFEVFSSYLDEISQEESENLLVSKIVRTIKNPVQKASDYASLIKQEALKMSFGQSFGAKYNPSLTYEFLTLNGKAKSNAKSIVIDDYYVYHHIWDIKTQNETSDLIIQLRVANMGWWYFFALIIPIAVMFIVIAILSLSKENKKYSAKDNPNNNLPNQ